MAFSPDLWNLVHMAAGGHLALALVTPSMKAERMYARRLVHNHLSWSAKGLYDLDSIATDRGAPLTPDTLNALATWLAREHLNDDEIMKKRPDPHVAHQGRTIPLRDFVAAFSGDAKP